MPKITVPIANGFYESASLPISAQRAVNWYPNVPQASTITDANLFPTPGINQIISVSSTGFNRGSHTMADIPYFVTGNSLYRLNRTFDTSGSEVFTFDNLGSIEGISFVRMADNGSQLCIVVPGGKSYIFDGSTLAEITDVNFDGPADSVVYVDGYFVFTKTTGKKFFNSPLQDGRGLPSGTAYDPLDFGTAEADPDQIRAAFVNQNQLYILGSETIQLFTNTARVPAPFQPVTSVVIPKGILSPFSVVSLGQSFAFIGGGVNEGPAIWQVSGTSIVKISTTAIDNKLSKLTDTQLENSFAWTYAEDGAYFVGFSIPDTCLSYDLVNQRWHERLSDVAEVEQRFRVSSMTAAYGRVLVGDLIDGRIGELDSEQPLEYGRLIRRFVTSQPFDNQGNRVSVSKIEAVTESGVGLTNDIAVNGNLKAGLNPKIGFSFSDDGGRTFSDQRFRGLGKKGEYKKRQIWNRNGRFTRSRVLKFEVSEPVMSTLIKVEGQINA